MNPGRDRGHRSGSAEARTLATSAPVGIDIAASAFRFRGRTTPIVGSLPMSRSATAARNTPRTIGKWASIVGGACRESCS